MGKRKARIQAKQAVGSLGRVDKIGGMIVVTRPKDATGRMREWKAAVKKAVLGACDGWKVASDGDTGKIAFTKAA